MYIKKTKNNKRKRNTYLDTQGMFFFRKLVVVVVLNAVARCGDAGIEPPSCSFAIAVVAGGWPSRVPCLPAIMHDYVMYLVWQHLSLQWL